GRARAPIWNEVNPPLAAGLPRPPVGEPPAAEAGPPEPAGLRVIGEPASEPPASGPGDAHPPSALPPGDATAPADPAADAARLGLALRQRSLGPAEALERAEAQLRSLPDAARDGPHVAALHLVRGDAYRMLGREEEAGAAYRACWTALERSAPDDADAASPPLEPLASPSDPQPEEVP
ncbi:MAG: hypothetical protein ACRDGL_06705, partial [Candidatus Limnocylindrales bacterium]